MTSGLIIVIVLYVIGAFLTALAIGFFNLNTDKTDKGFALTAIYLWPLILPIFGIVGLGDAIEDWTDRNPSTSHRICSIIDRITLPFRPISLGRKIREWLDNRHKRQCN